ncbi:MAG: PilT/PilU family type 4a pilus ATPase [Defluviitaleaceae bacterium]|nr:PilT/PilU family type 4a pilus ATPase [Defluviitaleaceae bacterium]
MDIMDILSEAVKNQSSDIFIIAGMPVTYKINEKFVATDTKPLNSEDTQGLVARIYDNITTSSLDKVKKLGDDDFSFALPGLSRFRVNVYKQRGSLAAVIRVIRFDLPKPEAVGIPKTVMDLADRRKGLILVTGTAGSGKSTTLACMIDRINRSRSEHIVTLEDPLEYLHRHDKSIISQREVHTDTESYVKALRASLRQAPDVVLLGEMRDHETISVAMTAAETGHLVFSTLHTVGAANTIDRIIDAFNANQQNQIRIQLAMVLQAVISQQLLPTVDGKLTPAFEVMIVNNAVRTMIRDAKIHQIDSVIHSSSAEGMITLDSYLINLLKAGRISAKTAIAYSSNPELMAKKI